MFDSFLDDDALIRLIIFLVVFAVFGLWEIIAPRRDRHYSKGLRWLNNLSISIINVIITRIAIPITLVFVADIAQSSSIGLLNIIELPALLTIVIAVLLLDLAIYIQHIIFHKVPFLWRLHRMHHADLDFDVTTAIRFHPIEIVLSLAIKMLIVLLIGAPMIAVLIFEVLLSTTSLFNHANIRMTKNVDKLLRLFVVTPDMHRVHHSAVKGETNSNFGFNLPWWDHIFKTYRAQPKAGHDDMTIGLEYFRDPSELRLDRLLLQPFKRAS